jgi:hypothetical protein
VSGRTTDTLYCALFRNPPSRTVRAKNEINHARLQDWLEINGVLR